MPTTSKSLPGAITPIAGVHYNAPSPVNSQGYTVAQMIAQTPTVTTIGPTGYNAANGPGSTYNAQTPELQYNPVGLANNYLSQYQAMIAAQRAALEQQYQANVGRVNTAFATEKQDVADSLNRAQGMMKTILGRAGGFTTTAGAGALNAQEQGAQGMVNKLAMARDDALAAAMAAKQSGQADLFTKNIDAMYKIHSDILKYQNEELKMKQELEQKAKDRLWEMQKAGYAYVNTPKLRDELKGQGYTMMEINGKTYAKAPEKSPIEKEYDFYRRGEIAAGRKPLGPNEYMTMDANRKKSVSVTNNYGNLPGQYDAIKAKLEASRGTDGYVNTDVYKRERTLVKDKAAFDKNYNFMLNPLDPTAKSLITKETVAEREQQMWTWYGEFGKDLPAAELEKQLWEAGFDAYKVTKKAGGGVTITRPDGTVINL